MKIRAFNTIHKKYVEHATEYFMNKLCPDFKGTILVSFQKLYKTKYTLAYCAQMSRTDFDIVMSNDWKKCHYMESHDDPFITFLHVLAHECVHVKQYYRNELIHLGKGNPYVRFNGKIYPTIKSTSNYTVDLYNNQPWEIEANTLGDQLADEYIELFCQHKDCVGIKEKWWESLFHMFINRSC